MSDQEPLTDGPAATDAATAKKNLKHGIILAWFVIMSVAMFMILFSRSGLPKDPKFFPKIDQRAQASQGQTGGAATSAPADQPAPSSLSAPTLQLESAPTADEPTAVPLRPKETVDE